MRLLAARDGQSDGMASLQQQYKKAREKAIHPHQAVDVACNSKANNNRISGLSIVVFRKKQQQGCLFQRCISGRFFLSLQQASSAGKK